MREGSSDPFLSITAISMGPSKLDIEVPLQLLISIQSARFAARSAMLFYRLTIRVCDCELFLPSISESIIPICLLLI